MTKPARVSFWIMAGMFILAGALHLAIPLLAALFSFLALERLHWIKRKWLAVSIFSLALLGLAYGLGHVVRQAAAALPAVAEKAIPSIIAYAEQKGIELPFTDLESLKDAALEAAKSQVHTLGAFANFAKGATREFLFLIIGVVVAISVFLNSRFDLDHDARAPRNNLYTQVCEEIAARFRTLYQSFETVMGAQLVISGINTGLTSIFVLTVHLPHALVVIGLTFLCGLIPVIGNLISNTIILAIAFTVSPKMALAALAFLILIHKLEYFLNSKIVGHRIRNPVWLTLLGLVLGERLMGIPGMVLAPVVLHYIKVEASRVGVPPQLTAEPTLVSTAPASAPDKNSAAG